MQGSGGVIGQLFHPTLVGHIHLNKQLFIKSFSLKLLQTKVYRCNKQLIIVHFQFGYFM
jgi:hypothetical protein